MYPFSRIQNEEQIIKQCFLLQKWKLDRKAEKRNGCKTQDSRSDRKATETTKKRCDYKQSPWNLASLPGGQVGIWVLCEGQHCELLRLICSLHLCTQMASAVSGERRGWVVQLAGASWPPPGSKEQRNTVKLWELGNVAIWFVPLQGYFPKLLCFYGYDRKLFTWNRY